MSQVPLAIARPARAPVRLLLLLLHLGWTTPVAALLPVPAFEAWVTDLAGVLTVAERETLESRLLAYQNRKGAQVAVLIVASTAGEALEAYALRVAEAWRLGRKDVDDGALLLVAVKDRALRIEVGYGLEGVLTDATSKRITDEAIVPHFRSGNLYAGINAGVERMLAVISGEALPPPAARASGGAAGEAFKLGLFLAFFFALMFQGRRGRALRVPLTAAASGGVTYLATSVMAAAGVSAVAAVMLSALFSGNGGGPGRWVSHRRYGDRYPGGWGQGFGGGGFGGGGGGTFGGGGASGRW